MERQQMSVSHKPPGRFDFLCGQKSINEIIKQPGFEKLDYIGRGYVPPNPSELLMPSRMKDLLDWASVNYDIVVVGTPSILAVTDPAIVGAHAGIYGSYNYAYESDE